MTTLHSRGRFSFSVLIALLLAGCATAPSPTPGQSFGSAGVCSLVPEMDTLVGRPAVGPPGGYTIEEIHRCTWTYQTDPSRYVGLTLGPARGHAGSIDAFGDGERVAGLGDDARWWPALGTLSVAVGDQSFQVNLELESDDVSQSLAVGIASSALANLP
jgi:hypothetical protein